MKRQVLISLGTFLLSGLLVAASFVYLPWIERIDPDGTPELIRLHIIAHSDSAADQRVKLQVRDAILAAMTEKFQGSTSLDQSREILLHNLPQMEEVARQVLREAGYTYEVKASHGVFAFPARTYGDQSFPAGNYEALRLVLGDGVGQNWWCVLYPPLCFVEEAREGAPIESTQDLQSRPYEVRFKLLDWIRE